MLNRSHDNIINHIYTKLEKQGAVSRSARVKTSDFKNSPNKGKHIIEAQSVNRSNVKILNAFSPSSIFGIGVVPPVPKRTNSVKESPKNKYLLLKNL